MIPIFFLTIIAQVCTNRTKNVFNTNCMALHVAPNVAHITASHGHMKKERLVLEFYKNNYMNGHMTLIPRY